MFARLWHLPFRLSSGWSDLHVLAVPFLQRRQSSLFGRVLFRPSGYYDGYVGGLR